MRACRPHPLRPASPEQRVVYTVLECQPLFDSSDMTITEWVQIAQTIEVTREGGEGWGEGAGGLVVKVGLGGGTWGVPPQPRSSHDPLSCTLEGAHRGPRPPVR